MKLKLATLKVNGIMKFRVFWDVVLCSHVEVDDVSNVHTASIIRAMNEFP
jgi:hypothetical protein